MRGCSNKVRPHKYRRCVSWGTNTIRDTGKEVRETGGEKRESSERRVVTHVAMELSAMNWRARTPLQHENVNWKEEKWFYYKERKNWNGFARSTNNSVDSSSFPLAFCAYTHAWCCPLFSLAPLFQWHFYFVLRSTWTTREEIPSFVPPTNWTSLSLFLSSSLSILSSTQISRVCEQWFSASMLE